MKDLFTSLIFALLLFLAFGGGIVLGEESNKSDVSLTHSKYKVTIIDHDPFDDVHIKRLNDTTVVIHHPRLKDVKYE